MLLSILCSGFRRRVYRGRKADRPANAYEWAIYYRAELQDDLEGSSGRRNWLCFAAMDLGYFLYFVGMLDPFHRGISFLSGVSWALFFLVSIPYGIFKRVAYCRKLQWKIRDLDTLLAQGAEKAGA